MTSALVPYRLNYAGRVLDEFRALVRSLGADGQEALDAAKELDRILCIYPQVGQELRDLPGLRATLWITVMAPLVVEYVVNEQERAVFVLAPFRVLARPRH